MEVKIEKLRPFAQTPSEPVVGLDEDVSDAEGDVAGDECMSDYRSAFLDEDTGEVYEGGWFPRLMKRNGLGICLYPDGRIYEGVWLMGKEHGRGQLLTGDRQPIYVGEWMDGLMHGHGTYYFSNEDRYIGE